LTVPASLSSASSSSTPWRGGRDGTIEIEDNCGGAFVTFRPNNEEGLSFNPDELLAIAKWAKKLCDEVTEFNGTGQK